MKRRRKALKLASMAFATHLSLSAEIRDGWFLAGSDPASYDSWVAKETAASAGTNPVCLKSIRQPQDGFGTLMQMLRADAYRGQRVRLSSYVRSDAVDGWAGLWMRVD